MIRFPCLVVLAFSLATIEHQVWAQDPGRKTSSANTRSLDLQADRVEMEFLKSLFDLSTSYEEAGAIDKSREMLKSILKIKPDADQVKKKLKEFDEAVFEDQTKTLDLDTSANWTYSGVRVTKGEPIRIEAEGDYKLMINTELGPDGYDQSHAARGLIAEIPTGALIGMVATATPPKKQKNPPEPNPFLIGKKREFTPEESGRLFLKVNTPPLAKCIGNLKVKLSGNIAP